MDLLELGGELFGGYTIYKAMKTLQENYPEDYIIAQELDKVCTGSKLEFKAVSPKPEKIVYYSEILDKGIFNQPEFKCFAEIDVESKSVTFIYRPENAEYVTSRGEIIYLLNWINAHFGLGKFFYLSESRNFLGKDVAKIAFEVSFSYKNYQKVTPEQYNQLINNLLANVFEFSELYLPALSLFYDLKLSFDNDIKPIINNETLVVQDIDSKRQQINKGIDNSTLRQLQDRLVEIFTNNQLNYELIPGQNAFKVQNPYDQEYLRSVIVSVSNLNQVLIESHSDKVSGANIHQDILLDYVRLENRSSSGTFTVNNDDGRVYYRTGIDLRGLESSVTDQMFMNLIAEHDSWILLTLEGLRHVQSGFSGLDISDSVLDFILAGGTIDPEVVNQRKENIKNPPESLESQLSNIQSESAQPADRSDEQPKTDAELILAKDSLYPISDSTRPEVISRPQKDPTIALILEILPGLFGLLGIGWLYSGNKKVGIPVLIGMLIWDFIAIVVLALSVGIGIFCLGPINLTLIAISAYLLNRDIKSQTA